MKRLTETELAKLWDLTPRTLQQWRATWEDEDCQEKLGPRFIRVGRRSVLYREEDVVAYEAANTVGKLPAPAGWDMTVKRAAGAFGLLADKAKTGKQQDALRSMRDELLGLING